MVCVIAGILRILEQETAYPDTFSNCLCLCPIFASGCCTVSERIEISRNLHSHQGRPGRLTLGQVSINGAWPIEGSAAVRVPGAGF